MHKRTIIIYSPQLPHCPLYKKIFDDRFQIHVIKTEGEFIKKVQEFPADAAVICICSADDADISLLERLNVLVGPLPVLTCSKLLHTEFIRKAALRGVERFLVCDMEAGKISDLVHEAIRDKGLRKYLESCWSGSDESSNYIHKFIDEIVHVFPHRMTVAEFARRIRIDRGWLHKICKQAFHRTPTALLRRVWIHQAMRMMIHTNLDNTEIASQLDYINESSMAREFRKELGYSPGEARKQLRKHTPEELLSPLN